MKTTLKTKSKSSLCVCVSVLTCAGMLLSLCSCSSSSSSKPVSLSGNQALSAEIKDGEQAYECTLKRGENGTWECRFMKPDTIKGMTMTLSGEVCSLEFIGMKYETERKDMPKYSAVSLITTAADKLISKKDIGCEKETDSKSKICTYTESGKVQGLEFSAEIKNEKLTSMKISENVTAKFKNI